jgi:superfamily II DNA or RNA helicase
MIDIEKTRYVKQVRITIQNEVNCIVSGLLPDHLEYFYNDFAVFAEGYFFQPKFKLHLWDGKIHYFHKDGKTFTMMLERIIPKVVAFGYKVILNDQRLSLGLEPPYIDATYFSYVNDPKTGEPWIIRPYQVDAINLCLQHGNGVIIAGTGAGKTVINAAICDGYGKLGARTITIVPNTTLIDQTVAWFDYYGMDVGEYSGESKDYKDHTHVISTWQALQYHPEIIRDFNVLIVDECHGAKAKVLGKLIGEHGQKISYRFGLTGTLPKDKGQVMAIKCALGDVRYTIPAHKLIADGYLATLDISIMQLDDKTVLTALDVPDGQFKDYDMEVDWMHIHEPRIEWISEFLIEKSQQHKGNVLCLVNNIAFGKKLHRLLPGSHFVYGKDKKKARKQVYDLFENNDNLTVVATVNVAGVGLSIDRIFNLIYIDGGKSFIRTIQAIGRGLRKAVDKDHVNVTDICGNLKHSKKHLNERVKYYKEARYPFKKYSVQYT